MLDLLLPHTFTFPFPLFNFLSHFYSKNSFLSYGSSSTSPLHLPLSLSPLELLDLFISPINYLTFSSTSLSFSPLELPDLFISPINCTPNSFLNPMLRFFLVSPGFLWFYCCLSLKGAFFSLWFLIGFAGFHAFIYFFIWFFCSAQFFIFWCSLFSWFYNFVVPKFFSRNVLIVVLTSFVFCCQYKWMLYNIILDIFPVHHTGLRLVFLTWGTMSY